MLVSTVRAAFARARHSPPQHPAMAQISCLEPSGVSTTCLACRSSSRHQRRAGKRRRAGLRRRWSRHPRMCRTSDNTNAILRWPLPKRPAQELIVRRFVQQRRGRTRYRPLQPASPPRSSIGGTPPTHCEIPARASSNGPTPWTRRLPQLIQHVTELLHPVDHSFAERSHRCRAHLDSARADPVVPDEPIGSITSISTSLTAAHRRVLFGKACRNPLRHKPLAHSVTLARARRALPHRRTHFSRRARSFAVPINRCAARRALRFSATRSAPS